MRVVDRLQSAIMYRTGKQLNGRANVFVFYPLIIVYVLSTTLLLAAEGAQASASQSEVKDAEQIVGRFLRNEAGSKWLAGLAKTRSTPLTTGDLMKELLKATRPNGRVFQAASILSDSFDKQIRMGITTQPILAQAENWKDIVEHIEEQDDIICLYRKSTEETAKKADDWKKFLRTVTPGYTVHLAIDTGRKYVICLKKIEVPETTPADISTTPEIPTTSEVSPVVRSTALFSTTPGNLKKMPRSGILRIPENKNGSRIKLESIDTSCRDSGGDGSEDCGNDSRSRDDRRDEVTLDKVFGYGSEDLSEEEVRRKTLKQGTSVDLSAGLEKYPVRFKQDRRGLDPPSTKRRKPSNDWPSEKMPGKMSPESTHDPECNRPIILVMQNGNDLSGYQPRRLPEISAQRNFRAEKLPWFASAPEPFARIPMPHPPPMLPMMHNIPRYGPNHYFMPPHKFPQPPKLNNLYKAGRPRQIFSHNSHTSYHIPPGKMQQPVVKITSQTGVHIMERPLRTMAKPVVQKNPKALVRPPGKKSQRPESYQRNPYPGNTMRYPFGRYSPNRNQGHLGPISGPNSVNHGPARNIRWKVPVRNVPLPRRRTPNESNMGRNVRQFLQKYPRSPSGQRPATLTTGKSISIKDNNIGTPRMSMPNHLAGPFRPCSASRKPLVRCGNPGACPLTGNPPQLNSSVPCQSPCNRPVKLQIVINGKVQEPLKISVIREPGQRVEIVGPGNPTVPYGSRALKKFDSELLEVKGRMLESEEDTKQYLDVKKTGNQTHMEKENNLNETVSLGESTTDKSVKLDEKHNSTVELRIETTTESIKDVEIGDRFLHEGPTEKNSTVESDTLKNTTSSTTTNSEIIE